MAETSLATKLRILPGTNALVLHAPEDVTLGPFPDRAHVSTAPNGTHDVVLLFTRDSQALARDLPGAIAAVARGGILWVAWPKKTAGVPTDLNRDVLWTLVAPHGWGPNSNIAINERWSALRFKEGARSPGRAG